ncbi:conserved domain protein [Acidithiobacillus ferrooxidans ATCC 23270]|uniref:Conserved domain protein n=1 Tax=Acidithiobacillus ferrooxidans (strain ATCC 23270 / DSM 14882 / CIP 104768 / NCIMB 8455) TaxID=243159 RepID=B7J8Y5_ACIF2|nr:conserved domain protein [Acidithiobacillus ferrooxidans ATCC 23270]
MNTNQASVNRSIIAGYMHLDAPGVPKKAFHQACRWFSFGLANDVQVRQVNDEVHVMLQQLGIAIPGGHRVSWT